MGIDEQLDVWINTLQAYLFFNLKTVLLAVYCAINVACVWTNAQGYDEQLLQIAKGSAGVIEFNLNIVFLSMLRVVMSRLKFVKYCSWLDRHIDLHKIAGNVVLLFSVVHCAAHLRRKLEYDVTFWTGIGLAICVFVMGICAQRFVRHSKRFELFYYSHYLLIPVVVLSMFHSSSMRNKVFLAIILYACDRCYRFWCSFYPEQVFFSKHYDDVLMLQISRPPNMSFRPGDIVYLCIPSVSKLQWHPFSISSSPARTHYFTVHMKIVKESSWTLQVAQLMQKYEIKRRAGVWINPLVYIDGALSAPNSSMLNQKHIVVVAQGIGATPYISLIEYLADMRTLRKQEEHAKMASHELPVVTSAQYIAHVQSHKPKLETIYFYWKVSKPEHMQWAEHILANKNNSDVKIEFIPVLDTVDSSYWDEQFGKHACNKADVFVCGSWDFAQTIKNTAKRNGLRIFRDNY